VRITAIVTGFEMDLGGLGLNKDLGNLVIIDENFQWEQPRHEGEVSIPAGPDTIKIGYNNSDNAKTFNFASDRKPVLCVDPGEKKADLEIIPAIRRSHS
jgi:hypothetical protein